MPRRKFNNNFQRIENKKPTKKEIKEHEQSIIENRIEFYTKISEKTNKSKLIEVSQHIINEYFDAEKIKFQTNKVHVIQGENGHGKSTLLTDIANAYFMDSLENHDHKIKKCCTNKNVAKVLNKGLPMNPYQMEDRPEGNTEFGLYSGLDYNTTPSIKNDEYVITWYIDFGVSYFISGDTKVCNDTISCLNMMNSKFVYNNINKTLNEQDIYDYMNNNDSLTCDFNNNKKKFKTTLAFHDYSNWDSFDQQVHACKYDWEKYYCEQDGKNKFSFLKKYHDSKPILIDRLLKNEDIKFESLYTHFKLNKFCIKTNCMNTSKYIDLNLLKQIFDFNTINIFYSMENHGVTINFIFGLKDKNKYDQIKYLNLQCYYSIHNDKYSKIRFDSGNFNLFELDIFETDFFRDYIVVNSVITNRSTLSLVHLDFIKEIDHRSIYYKNGKNELKNTAMDLEKYRTYVEYKKLKEESEKIF